MPFYFTCPFCLHKTLISEQLSGQTGACVGCGKSVTVPAPPAPRRVDIAPAEESKLGPALVAVKKGKFPLWLVRGVIYSVLALPIIIAAGWYLQPVIMNMKLQRDIVLCQGNLQKIAKALNSYAADHGTYPPAITYGPDGKAWHSWRVLILPYLGAKNLYKSYDMSKPWDAPENSHLQAQIPAVFVSPGNSNIAIGESNYMLITGPSTLFPVGSPPVSPQSIPDGAANTILVVETNTRMTSWIEPIDLSVGKLPPSIGLLDGIGGTHTNGATIVFASGRTAWLPGDTNKPVIDGLISPAGGEAVFGDWYK